MKRKIERKEYKNVLPIERERVNHDGDEKEQKTVSKTKYESNIKRELNIEYLTKKMRLRWGRKRRMRDKKKKKKEIDHPPVT